MKPPEASKRELVRQWLAFAREDIDLAAGVAPELAESLGEAVTLNPYGVAALSEYA